MKKIQNKSKKMVYLFLVFVAYIFSVISANLVCFYIFGQDEEPASVKN